MEPESKTNIPGSGSQFSIIACFLHGSCLHRRLVRPTVYSGDKKQRALGGRLCLGGTPSSPGLCLPSARGQASLWSSKCATFSAGKYFLLRKNKKETSIPPPHKRKDFHSSALMIWKFQSNTRRTGMCDELSRINALIHRQVVGCNRCCWAPRDALSNLGKFERCNGKRGARAAWVTMVCVRAG